MKTKTTKATVKKSSKKSTASSAPAAAPVASASGSTPVPISESQVAQCQTYLNGIDTVLGPVTQLSADDIRRSLKLRKGGAQVVTQLIALCNHHQVTAVGPATVASMSAEKARADALNQIEVQYAAVGKKLRDAKFSAESNTWQQATALYTVLQRLAVMDPTLDAGLEPVQAFFQTKTTKSGQRAATAERKLTKAQKAASKYATSSTEPAAPPGATNGGTGAPAGTANGTSVSAPVAATPVTAAPVTAAPVATTPAVATPAATAPVAVTNGVAHS
jgi:hypothetical protein